VEFETAEEIASAVWNTDTRMQHALDCDFTVHEWAQQSRKRKGSEGGRPPPTPFKTQMIFCPANTALPVNYRALRILMDRFKLQYSAAPDIVDDRSIVSALQYAPRGPVIFLRARGRGEKRPTSLTPGELKEEWPLFFRNGMPYETIVKAGVFKHFSEAISEAFYQGPNEARKVIECYLRENFSGRAGQAERAQMTLLSAALLMAFGDKLGIPPVPYVRHRHTRD
jgi:hypothetical protein